MWSNKGSLTIFQTALLATVGLLVAALRISQINGTIDWRLEVGGDLAAVTLAAIVWTLELHFRLIRPLWRLGLASKSLALGNFDAPLPLGQDEVGQVASSFEIMRTRLRAVIEGAETRNAIAELLNTPAPLESLLERICLELKNVVPCEGIKIIINETILGSAFTVISKQEIKTPKKGAVQHSFPVNFAGTTFGKLEIQGAPNQLDSEQELLFQTVAQQISLTLERYRLISMLQKQATTDGLTGVYNYRYLIETLGHQVALSQRAQEPCSIMMMDIDNFKSFNDQYGHAMGDYVLRTFAQALSQTVRSSDVIGRYGGEEFLVVMPQINKEAAAALAERIRSQIAKTDLGVWSKKQGVELNLTASIGVATYPEDGENPAQLLANADAALYFAKEAGRNLVGVPD